MSFSSSLIRWYHRNKRVLPWRDTKNPYHIWLSEIILQQTRVEQGLPYFEQFIKKYPTLKQLAAAPEDDVLKLWQGLGYYSRARNMLATARIIVKEHKAVFPKTAAELSQLKGIGPYTAAAVASFAFGEAVPVVDGNVFRVLSRYLGFTTPIDSSGARR
ncbi:MAG TPA: A/G-specific adenine glycosylase, partial [Bacteroidia bacterium]|nr:A/G-specific adenine glycosylase [Bacteroidia bacterium]